jgi:hypothetical protein
MHTCHAVHNRKSNVGGSWPRQAWTKKKVKPYLQNNQRNGGWNHGTSDTVPAWQMQTTEFKPYNKPKRKKKSFHFYLGNILIYSVESKGTNLTNRYFKIVNERTLNSIKNYQLL